jgi:hypothetical protein
MMGDVLGMAEPGEASDKVAARFEQLKVARSPRFPVELLTLSGDPAKGCGCGPRCRSSGRRS